MGRREGGCDAVFVRVMRHSAAFAHMLRIAHANAVPMLDPRAPLSRGDAVEGSSRDPDARPDDPGRDVLRRLATAAALARAATHGSDYDRIIGVYCLQNPVAVVDNARIPHAARCRVTPSQWTQGDGWPALTA